MFGFGAIGGALASRIGIVLSGTTAGFGGEYGGISVPGGHGGVQNFVQRFYKLPFVHGGQFGLGYTSLSYVGYGATNTADPFGIHKPKYSVVRHRLGMPYGRYGYRRYRRYRRYGSRYRYRRRAYYRRRYY